MFERQFGQFLIMVGGLLMVLFVFSYAANQMNFWLFLAGAGLLFWGARILVKFPGEPRPKAERFRLVKKLNSRKKKEAKKEEKKDEKKKEEKK